MNSEKFNLHAIEVNLYGQPLSEPEIEEQRKRLKTVYSTYLNYILAIFVLGAAVSYRALSLDFDSEYELFKLSLYIGLWFGLFTGLMIDGNAKRKLQMIIVGILVSTSTNLFASMLVTLFVGEPAIWITSINILASALGSMWVLTSYDEVIQGFDSIKFTNKRQQYYINKAAEHFEEIKLFKQKIEKLGRDPIIGEYWATREWIQNKINSTSL